MSLPSLATLLVQETKASILKKALQIASAVGLDTETWRKGDPTLAAFNAFSQIIETLEAGSVNAVSGGFIRLAEGAWKKLCAYHVYNVEAIEASTGTCTCLLTNATGAQHDFDVGDLVARNSTTGALYRNSEAGTLLGLDTLSLAFVAEVAGSGSTSAVSEIDELVTAIAGVTISNTTGAVGEDEESESALEARCLAKLGSFSPAGPADAYRYIAVTPSLNGGAGVNRATIIDTVSDDGEADIILAGPAGEVSNEDRTLVEDACEGMAPNIGCVPIGFRANFYSATPVSVNVSATLYVYDKIGRLPADISVDVEAALTEAIGGRPIGGDDDGYLYRDLLRNTALDLVFPYGIRFDMVTPAADVALTATQVATVGTVSVTVVIRPSKGVS